MYKFAKKKRQTERRRRMRRREKLNGRSRTLHFNIVVVYRNRNIKHILWQHMHLFRYKALNGILFERKSNCLLFSMPSENWFWMLTTHNTSTDTCILTNLHIYLLTSSLKSKCICIEMKRSSKIVLLPVFIIIKQKPFMIWKEVKIKWR